MDPIRRPGVLAVVAAVLPAGGGPVSRQTQAVEVPRA
jgi:hypothetical protein